MTLQSTEYTIADTCHCGLRYSNTMNVWLTDNVIV